MINSKKQISLYLLLAVISMSGLSAQDYKTAAGVRFGETSGITLRQKVAQSKYLEGIFGIWENGFSITVLAEKKTGAFDVPRLNWIYGFGGHIVIYDDNIGRRDRRVDADLGAGVDGLLSIEYSFEDIPFAVSAGFKPFLEFDTDGRTFISPDPGIGLKFIF